ncbi:DUF4232 domain-containing protein [Streptomyces sp. NPDC048349]|uniref:DUF4232 domain-containing protein n=1 Tax=Streptomyces sp. NPDC048349 TaxID=3155486 RepID=UPI0034263A76
MPGTTGSAKPSAGASKTGGNGGGNGDGAIAPCTAAGVSVSATNEDEKGATVKHLLLTLTNISGKKCTVHHYPSVLVGTDAQAPVPVIKDSDPKALATLAPGEKAHAALLVRGGHRDEYPAYSLVVTLQGPKLGDREPESIKVALPGVDVVWADDGARVTYWTTASGYALDFIMSS